MTMRGADSRADNSAVGLLHRDATVLLGYMNPAARYLPDGRKVLRNFFAIARRHYAARGQAVPLAHK